MKDLTGIRMERLTITNKAGVDKRGEVLWNCLCDCGNEFIALGGNLRSGHTKSCGCLKLEGNNLKHGMCGTRVYGIWGKLIQRCTNPNSTHYQYYGGRGIKVCDSWLTFENFYADMGDPPSEDSTIDRINNDGNYCKENCCWRTPKEQARNRSSNVELTYNGKTQCIRAWEEELGFNSGTLWTRLYNYNWPIEKAMTEPVKKINRELIEFNGKTQSLAQHARDVGLKPKTVNERIRQGKPLEEALTVPLNKRTK